MEKFLFNTFIFVYSMVLNQIKNKTKSRRYFKFVAEISLQG